MGWGGHLGDLITSSIWSSEEKLLHIVLELKAAFLGLKEFREKVEGHSVVLKLDNITMVAYVNKQGGLVSLQLHSLTVELHHWAIDNSVELSAEYIPGKKNLVSDTLSHQNQIVGMKWSLHQAVADRLFQVWGRPTLDLFATYYNKKLEVYCSVILDPLALAEDAFQHPWDNLEVYAFPPFCLLRQVLNRVVRSRNLKMTLVASLWLQAEWFAALLFLLSEVPREIPPWRQLLGQLHVKRFHHSVESLSLHRWRLSSISSEQEDFLRRQQGICPAISGSPRLQSTKGNGQYTVIGVVDGVCLRSKPLFTAEQIFWSFSEMRKVFLFLLSEATALAFVLCLRGVNISSSWEISLLFKGFEQTCSPRELKPLVGCFTCH
ncbi:uncharacterized protein LOC135201227 [Macrobrachium nipponense]|uniref:uncharacterized protein LOC135201227 n=1 Tax=Macrobrachium nipponense TaxID=159736 RepID=UPI0030C7D610